jgi:hypothetical protein
MNISKRRLKYISGHPASFTFLVGILVITAFSVLIYLIDTTDTYRLGILVFTGLSMWFLCKMGDYAFKLYHLLQERNNHD